MLYMLYMLIYSKALFSINHQPLFPWAGGLTWKILKAKALEMCRLLEANPLEMWCIHLY